MNCFMCDLFFDEFFCIYSSEKPYIYVCIDCHNIYKKHQKLFINSLHFSEKETGDRAEGISHRERLSKETPNTLV